MLESQGPGAPVVPLRDLQQIVGRRSAIVQRAPSVAGTWLGRDGKHTDLVCQQLALKTRAMIANVEFPLAPEHKYPGLVRCGSLLGAGV